MRGGKRPGAGRPIGSKTKRTSSIVLRAAGLGLTPLEVMLRAMHEHVAKGEWGQAAQYAHIAAPYVHPRLAAIEHRGELNVTQAENGDRDFIAQQLDRQAAAGGAAEAASEPDAGTVH